MENPGERLLLALRAAGCPDTAGLRGSDLDWMFGDAAAAEWLGRLADAVASDTVLTPEEADGWEALRRDRPGAVLEGEVLAEALKAVDESPSSSPELTADELRARLAALEDELASLPARALHRSSAGLSAAGTGLGMRLSSLRAAAEGGPGGRALRAAQEEVLRESARLDRGLDEAAEALEELAGRLTSEEEAK